jgi:hypothetical protein
MAEHIFTIVLVASLAVLALYGYTAHWCRRMRDENERRAKAEIHEIVESLRKGKR